MTTPEPSTLSEQEFDALETKVKADCNEHVNGYCHTVACLKRGGWEKGCNPANFAPSCEAKQILRLIAQARADRPSPSEAAWIELAQEMYRIIASLTTDQRDDLLPDWFRPRLLAMCPMPPDVENWEWVVEPSPPAQDGGRP